MLFFDFNCRTFSTPNYIYDHTRIVHFPILFTTTNPKSNCCCFVVDLFISFVNLLQEVALNIWKNKTVSWPQTIQPDLCISAISEKTNHLLMFFIIKILLKGTIQNVSTIRLRFIANLFGGKRVGMSWQRCV